MSEAGPDHGSVDSSPLAAPLAAREPAPRPTAAEAARTLVAATNRAALATLSDEGEPWASLVTYGTLPDGHPVLWLSHLAEHGRNIVRDPRASLLITQTEMPTDALAASRVTLAGRVEGPAEPQSLAAARAAHLHAVPQAAAYIDFSDFSCWVLHVERVRWVGGYGRMDSASGAEYASAQADPVAAAAGPAVAHLNHDHADALLVIAQTLGGYPDATEASCTGLDRLGIDLALITPRGRAPTRVPFPTALTAASQLRAATVELTRRARNQGAAMSPPARGGPREKSAEKGW